MNRVLPVLALSVGLVTCQTYDFERVTPVAVSQTSHPQTISATLLKPNIMLLVDKSGSMNLPANAGNPGGPSRLDEMKSAMNTFFGTSGTIARYGLVTYPVPADQCAPANTVDVALPTATVDDVGTESTLAQQAQQVNERIQSITALGGTPTSGSVFFVAQEPELNRSVSGNNDNRGDYILLLTDGLPNCSPVNVQNLCDCAPNCDAPRIEACACTIASCNIAQTAAQNACSIGCLDGDGSVGVISELATDRSIKTIVVGFGADLVGGDAPAVLNAMAEAGGFARNCKKNQDACGAEACDPVTKLCETKYYAAADGAALSLALEEILKNIDSDPCQQVLSTRPSDPRFLAVIVDGQTLTVDVDYRYDGDRAVEILGETCQKLHDSTPQDPVSLDIRVVEKL